ncbi:putative tetrameric tRNA splicing endonuclease (nucleomorph) [Chroomonas mesostigmatica CCMP1168]|uniref:tRNA-intron lyase n=1 Tax=Chroomonas mesostigmatica CCMP1168 TaxID=1195612 RepID=J7G1A2_9CRYP|nr:putative tetrameric tRNA splicing endonuclease [Chroomonas mesostigmatica CCMP1168]
MRIKITHAINGIFLLQNNLDILMLRNEYRIQGSLFLFSSFFLKNKLFLIFFLEEILTGIELGFISLRKINFKKKTDNKFLLTKFFSKKIKLKKKINSRIESVSNFSIRNWRENFFIVTSITKCHENEKNYEKKFFSFSNISTLNPCRKKKLRLPFLIKNFQSIKFTDYIVFRDLWVRGFVITCGLKFGATFIVYAGNIEYFHASLSVFSVKPFCVLFSIDFISFGRVGTCTKKRTLIAFLTKNIFINYCGIKWINSIP